MRLRCSRRAEAALEEVVDYIARDNPMWAASFARELRKRCRRLVAFPRAPISA
jgi:plasmid stabilization system protein ParE